MVSAPVNRHQPSLYQAAHTSQGSKFSLIRQNSPIIDNHHAHLRDKRQFELTLHIQKLVDQLIKHIAYTGVDTQSMMLLLTYNVLNIGVLAPAGDEP